jgi:hypothetical protein
MNIVSWLARRSINSKIIATTLYIYIYIFFFFFSGFSGYVGRIMLGNKLIVLQTRIT